MQDADADEIVEDDADVDFWENTDRHVVNYSDEVSDGEEAVEKYEMLIARFERLFEYDARRDAGAVMFYHRNGKMCGYFDYELFIGYYL